ncbi:MAG: tetratricopeptide repeat protein, partial [Sphingomicrobium sp.]
GRHCWNTGTQAGLEQSLVLFEQALKADPTYARAYAGIADALVALGNQTALDPKLAYPQARTAAQNALRLDPTLADAHASLGLVAFIHDWDLATAGTELHKAVALDPASATARQHLARYLGSSGQFDAAIDQALAAVELDPLSLSANSLLGASYRMARRYDDSIDQLERSLTIFPDQFPILYHLTFGYACAGRSEDALGAADSMIRVAGRSLFALGALGYARALFIGADEGRAIAAEMESAAPEHYVCPYDLATIYAACGDLDLAVKWLENAIDERDHALLFLKVDPALDAVRDRVGYRALISRLDGMMLQSADRLT